MNLNNIIAEIEKADPEVYERIDSRRKALKAFRNIGSRIALATVPIALGSLMQKAYAGTKSTQDTIVEILNYALTLEYLEAEFYNTALGSAGLLPSGDTTIAIQIIAKHENAHVQFLKTAIMSLGGTPVTKPNFDFSGGMGSGMGPFAGVFSNFEMFLNVAQTLEDTGVRAYKGRAPELVQGGDLLTAALRIHSVEARHAAKIRMLRKAYGSGIGDVKPWITGNMSNINSPAVQPSYNGEDNTLQLGIQIVNINSLPITFEDATEAFDEPLSKAQVLAIVSNFIVP